MPARKIYALYDKGTMIGEYTSMEIAMKLDMQQSTVANCAINGMAYRGRYTFEVVDEMVGKTRKEPLWKKWDEARLKILGAGRNISGN